MELFYILEYCLIKSLEYFPQTFCNRVIKKPGKDSNQNPLFFCAYDVPLCHSVTSVESAYYTVQQNKPQVRNTQLDVLTRAIFSVISLIKFKII